MLPSSFSGGGIHHVVEESRRVEIWSGYLRGDARARVVGHFEPIGERTLGQVVKRVASGLNTSYGDGRPLKLRGASKAHRLDGLMYGFSHSPAELERVIVLLAVVRGELLTVRVSAWQRDGVEREMERIFSSFRLEPSG